MIDITSISDAAFVNALHTVGGFAWWYVDLTDGRGGGLVLVWAYGLPFLPKSRDLRAAPGSPSLHLASYREGQNDLYLLQQFGADQAELHPDGRGQLGRSSFSISVGGTKLQLDARLDLDVPASEHGLRAHIELQGPPVRLPGEDDFQHHAWTPRSVAALGRATLEYDGETRVLEGAAYFDSNVSRLPLHAQGIESWRWGRVSFADETLVYYDVTAQSGERSAIVLSQTKGHELSFIKVAPIFTKPKRGNFGLAAPRVVDIETPEFDYRITLDDLVDDGPFYQRYLVYAKRWRKTEHSAHAGTAARAAMAASGHGVAEVVYPSRVDVSWQRPFIAMKTHYIGQTNSALLPFFTGFRHDREQRLAASLLRKGRP